MEKNCACPIIDMSRKSKPVVIEAEIIAQHMFTAAILSGISGSFERPIALSLELLGIDSSKVDLKRAEKDARWWIEADMGLCDSIVFTHHIFAQIFLALLANDKIFKHKQKERNLLNKLNDKLDWLRETHARPFFTRNKE